MVIDVKHKYYTGALLMLLPIPLMYTSVSFWISVIIGAVGLIIYNWKPKEDNVHRGTWIYNISVLSAAAMGVSWVNATKQQFDLILLFDMVFYYIPFQISYVIFLVSHTYLKVRKVAVQQNR